MSIGHLRFRAAIYHYVDLGTDGRSDPRYVKQESDKSDGNWWCRRVQVDGKEVVRGGKPEYRVNADLLFHTSAPLEAPQGSHVAILMADTEEIYWVRALFLRELGHLFRQVRVELSHDSILTATYSDGYYYAD
jgi:hypothetical protein